MSETRFSEGFDFDIKQLQLKRRSQEIQEIKRTETVALKSLQCTW